jgi:hypothetical protein
MHGRCGKCISGYSKNLKLRISFEGLSADWLRVLQVTLNKQGVRVGGGLFWLGTGLRKLAFWRRQWFYKFRDTANFLP